MSMHTPAFFPSLVPASPFALPPRLLTRRRHKITAALAPTTATPSAGSTPTMTNVLRPLLEVAVPPPTIPEVEGHPRAATAAPLAQHAMSVHVHAQEGVGMWLGVPVGVSDLVGVRDPLSDLVGLYDSEGLLVGVPELLRLLEDVLVMDTCSTKFFHTNAFGCHD
jgi:hypothetical protein